MVIQVSQLTPIMNIYTVKTRLDGFEYGTFHQLYIPTRWYGKLVAVGLINIVPLEWWTSTCGTIWMTFTFGLQYSPGIVSSAALSWTGNWCHPKGGWGGWILSLSLSLFSTWASSPEHPWETLNIQIVLSYYYNSNTLQDRKCHLDSR